MNIEDVGVLFSKTLNESSNQTVETAGNIGKLICFYSIMYAMLTINR